MAASSETPILRVAVAGLGTAGCMMLPALQKHPQVQIMAAADVDPEPLHAFERDFQAAGYARIDDLCESPNVDAIYIATPTHLHTEHALRALERGKYVVLEKPMALTLEDAELIIQTAERTGTQLVVGHSHSFERPIRRMRAMVQSGELGALRMLHNWYFTDWMYRPRNPGELDTTLGGGVTFRQGSHQFDILRLIGGGLVRSVRAMTGMWDERRPTEGSHVVYLEFEDGTPATAVYSGYDRFHTTELTFEVGEQGQRVDMSHYARARQALRVVGGGPAEVDLKRSASRYGGRRPRPRVETASHPPFYGLTVVSCDQGDIRQSADGLLIYGEDAKREIPLPTVETGRDAVIRELYEAVVYDRPPAHGGRWGKANLEVCLAVLASARERKEVWLSHQIPTHDEAL
jgi:phthalate 4,5-cis-dihydrodiol dehydrogenase